MKITRPICLLTVAALATSCFSSGKLQEENVVDTLVPMVFGTSSSQAETPQSKASATLAQGFKVNTWKRFGEAGQQTVMDGYKVDYTPSASSKWDYVGVNGQIQRYWDLSAFPYEFRAVSPWSEDVTITQEGITIGRTFYGQTFRNGVYDKTGAECEPFVVAQVRRSDLGAGLAERYQDRDLIKDAEINTSARADATRSVHMPFHHLLCKVGFRVFIDDPQPSSPDYQVTLLGAEVSVVKDGFLTKGTYAATAAQGLGRGTFTDPSPVSGEYCLFKQEQAYAENLRDYLNREGAFDLTPGQLQQIPQEGVKIRVQIRMQTHNGGVVDGQYDYDVLLNLDKTNPSGDLFTWESDTRYIYYLHIPNLQAHKIFLDTCEVLPWDIVETDDIPVDVE